MHRQFASFVLIGLTVNAIYAILFLSIVSLAPDRRVLASVIAYVSACLFQYAANARLTFQRRAANAGQFVRYVLCVGLGLVLSTLFLKTAPNWLGGPDWLLIVISAGSLAVMNFFLFRLWVYKR